MHTRGVCCACLQGPAARLAERIPCAAARRHAQRRQRQPWQCWQQWGWRAPQTPVLELVWGAGDTQPEHPPRRPRAGEKVGGSVQPAGLAARIAGTLPLPGTHGHVPPVGTQVHVAALQQSPCLSEPEACRPAVLATLLLAAKATHPQSSATQLSPCGTVPRSLRQKALLPASVLLPGLQAARAAGSVQLSEPGLLRGLLLPPSPPFTTRSLPP